MAVISGRGRLITHADALFRTWFGAPEPVGRSVHEVLRGHVDLPELDDVVDGCLAGGEPFQTPHPRPARLRSAGGAGEVFVGLTFAPLPRAFKVASGTFGAKLALHFRARTATVIRRSRSS